MGSNGLIIFQLKFFYLILNYTHSCFFRHSKLADGSLRQDDEARKGKGVKRKLVSLHPGLPPKKKDGRGRPRKDRSAELLQTSQVTAGPTVVGSQNQLQCCIKGQLQ